MSVITPRGRDRSSTLIESNYDPQVSHAIDKQQRFHKLIKINLKLPKDMFGFPVETKYLAAYQDFLVTHLSQSIKQYPILNFFSNLHLFEQK